MFYTLVLPSIHPEVYIIIIPVFVSLNVGEIHRVVCKCNSRSPLCFCWFLLVWFVFHVGENTQGSVVLKTLVLPPMNRNPGFCCFCHFEHFDVFAKWGPMVHVMIYIVVGYPYYMYIYSLGHFLTTKGALIDGDGYPPKNPKNDPKKG